ncbi:hypothetical protein L218DRAFT_950672 [Marasmius fiardii PR-910]|nr:hypothetical protein L218DRAFT_950672 [Marasmius fiardii PR-910]
MSVRAEKILSLLIQNLRVEIYNSRLHGSSVSQTAALLLEKVEKEAAGYESRVIGKDGGLNKISSDFVPSFFSNLLPTDSIHGHLIRCVRSLVCVENNGTSGITLMGYHLMFLTNVHVTGQFTTLQPTAIDGQLFKVRNGTQMDQKIAFGTVTCDNNGCTLTPTFLFKVGENSVATVNFHPKLLLYANSQYQRNVETGLIWSVDLTDLEEVSDWIFTEGSYAYFQATDWLSDACSGSTVGIVDQEASFSSKDKSIFGLLPPFIIIGSNQEKHHHKEEKLLEQTIWAGWAGGNMLNIVQWFPVLQDCLIVSHYCKYRTLAKVFLSMRVAPP